MLENVFKVIRNWFFTGLLVVFPPGITLYFLFLVFNWIDESVARHLPEAIADSVAVRVLASTIAVLIPVLTIILAGMAAETYVGTRLRVFYESLITRLPVLGRVFTWIRQISEMVLTNRREVFTRVALVEYPRKGIWTMAFLSSPAAQEICDKTKAELVSVYVPTTPNPTSGYHLMLPENELILLDLPPEEALRIVLSCGIIVPERQTSPAAD